MKILIYNYAGELGLAQVTANISIIHRKVMTATLVTAIPCGSPEVREFTDPTEAVRAAEFFVNFQINQKEEEPTCIGDRRHFSMGSGEW